ncbi:MAG: hypothetical protein LBL41_02885 [Bifidobacteriaceae bacterium]|jgi:hypothetical protein|nr:hypothetical protein [Bifidobacteriaceae bacterium]
MLKKRICVCDKSHYIAKYAILLYMEQITATASADWCLSNGISAITVRELSERLKSQSKTQGYCSIGYQKYDYGK